MKKVLLISNMYPSSKFPHYGIFVKNIEDIIKDDNLIVEKVVIKKTKNKFLKLFMYLNFFIKSIFKVFFGNFDYIYIHYPSLSGIPIILTKVFKKNKIIINIHGNDLVPESSKDSLFIKNTFYLSSISYKVIVPSKYFKSKLLEEMPDISKKIIVSPSGGVDQKIFKKINRDVALTYLGLDRKHVYVGYVSRIESSKGWDTFLEMISKNKNRNIKFIVVGSGSEEPQYNTMVEELGISDYIIKYNYLTQVEMNYIFNILDIFVFPTYRASESLGLVGLEAMNTNTIVLAANNYGPASYVVNKKNGFLFKSKDATDLLDKINRIMDLSDSEKYKIHENAEKTVDCYSKEKVQIKMKSIFEV